MALSLGKRICFSQLPRLLDSSLHKIGSAGQTGPCSSVLADCLKRNQLTLAGPQHLYYVPDHRTSCPSTHCFNTIASRSFLSTCNTTTLLGQRWISTTARGCFSIKDFSTKPKPSEDPVDESKLSLLKRFKLMYQRYWYVLIPVHLATSAVWYGAFFIAAKNGVDIVPILKSMGVTSDKILGHFSDSNMGYYAIAYAMYKVATPARYTITLGGTTISINYLKNRGYIKPVPTKEQVKEIYKEKRGEIQGIIKVQKRQINSKLDSRKKHMKERLMETKEMMGKLGNKRDQILGKLDHDIKKNIPNQNQIKKRLKNTSLAFTDKLEKLKDGVENLSEKATSKFRKK